MGFLEYQILDLKNVLCREVPFQEGAILQTLKSIRDTGQTNQESTSTRFTPVFHLVSGQQATLCWQSDNGEISAYEGVECKSRLYIENAVRARYEGDFMEVWQGVEELEQYIRRQKFLQITDAYCMVLYGLDNVEDLKNTIVNIYCGVSKNQL